MPEVSQTLNWYLEDILNKGRIEMLCQPSSSIGSGKAKISEFSKNILLLSGRTNSMLPADGHVQDYAFTFFMHHFTRIKRVCG
jgi:hypothetical protein